MELKARQIVSPNYRISLDRGYSSRDPDFWVIYDRRTGFKVKKFESKTDAEQWLDHKEATERKEHDTEVA